MIDMTFFSSPPVRQRQEPSSKDRQGKLGDVIRVVPVKQCQNPEVNMQLDRSQSTASVKPQESTKVPDPAIPEPMTSNSTPNENIAISSEGNIRQATPQDVREIGIVGEDETQVKIDPARYWARAETKTSRHHTERQIKHLRNNHHTREVVEPDAEVSSRCWRRAETCSPRHGGQRQINHLHRTQHQTQHRTQHRTQGKANEVVEMEAKQSQQKASSSRYRRTPEEFHTFVFSLQDSNQRPVMVVAHANSRNHAINKLLQEYTFVQKHSPEEVMSYAKSQRLPYSQMGAHPMTFLEFSQKLQQSECIEVSSQRAFAFFCLA